jgi:hypothetical protein
MHALLHLRDITSLTAHPVLDTEGDALHLRYGGDRSVHACVKNDIHAFHKQGRIMQPRHTLKSSASP